MKKTLRMLAFLLLVQIALGTCATAEEFPYSVSAPSGAPAIALATLASQSPDAFTFVAPDTIAAEFANATSDFIIAPLNAGAKLFKAGKSSYQLAGVVTWGNLYFASQRENFLLSDIQGQTLTLFGENTINASVVLYALEQSGITPENVEYLAGAANTQALLLSDPQAIVVTAEPALTAAGIKNTSVKGYPVNDLLRDAGMDGYAQAALFVRADTLRDQPEMVKWFLQKAQEACDKCTSSLEEVARAAVELEILPNEKVALSAIPGCSIRFVSAADAREAVEKTAQIDLAQFGGELPSDAFYYAGE